MEERRTRSGRSDLSKGRQRCRQVSTVTISGDHLPVYFNSLSCSVKIRFKSASVLAHPLILDKVWEDRPIGVLGPRKVCSSQAEVYHLNKAALCLRKHVVLNGPLLSFTVKRLGQGKAVFENWEI